MKIDITAFAAERPKVAGHLLPEQNATLANDARLTDGRLRAYRNLLDVQSLSVAPKSLYQYRDGGNTYWFDWAQDVDVVRSPVADDPNNRVYMTGTVNGPRFTDNQLAIGGGTDYPVNTQQLGMPEPAAVTVAVSGGQADPQGDSEAKLEGETRFYTCTWVDTNGREGPPGLPSNEVVVNPGQIVTVTLPTSFGSIDLDVTHLRLYVSTAAGTWQLCTQVGLSGSTVTDIPVGTATVTDDTPLDKRGETLKTDGWNAPPFELKGMVILPGGVAVGFLGKELFFSEPYHLYAWPAAYRLTLDYEIRSLAVAGNSVIIGTEGKPYVAFGTEPAAMTIEQLDTAHACVSKRSMVDMGDMALYASPDGLVRIAGTRADLMTKSIINPKAWRERFDPATVHACFHDGKYFGFYGTASDGGGFIFDPENGDFTEISEYASACYRDLEDDTLYLGIGASIKAWDKGTGLQPYQWRSKVFQGRPVKFTSARVLAQSYSNLTFKLYRDDELVMTQVVSDDRGFRLPSGRGSRWSIELTGTDTVFAVSMATSMGEL